MGLKKYRVHVELSKQLPQTNSLYTLCMTYIVRAATKVDAKLKGEFAAKATETAPSCVKRWVQPGGLERLSAVRLQQIARALDGGVLVTEDGCEVELYGGKAR